MSPTAQIQAWNPSTNRLINGLARDSDGSDLFIGGRFSRVNVDPDDPFNTGQTRSGVAKVDEAAGAANPNWVAPLQPSTDLTTLMVSGSWVYLAGTVRVAPGGLARRRVQHGEQQRGPQRQLAPGARGRRPVARGGRARRSTSGAGRSSTGPQPAIIGVDATNFPETGTPSFAPALGRGRQALPSGQVDGRTGDRRERLGRGGRRDVHERRRGRAPQPGRDRPEHRASRRPSTRR